MVTDIISEKIMHYFSVHLLKPSKIDNDQPPSAAT